ncbi:protein of unknown function [Petrocella atlantisensis]|uniref:Uncharacterized protein n=1 Tax=Petrocella atlantisensis TaxID=2173034 RepID=A0A3P7NZY8_9FIRM|nr:protein of unknown function [Petrocella atlantisensis]
MVEGHNYVSILCLSIVIILTFILIKFHKYFIKNNLMKL